MPPCGGAEAGVGRIGCSIPGGGRAELRQSLRDGVDLGLA